MPPKKTTGTKHAVSKPKGVVATQKKQFTSKKATLASKGQGTAASSKKAPGKAPSKTKVVPKKQSLSPEDKAAIKIQSVVRMFLGCAALGKLKEEKKRYSEMMEQIQKQAWLDIVQREREEEQKKRQKEEEEQKRKREEAKFRRDIIEAAFDGEVDKIEEIMGKAEKSIQTSLLMRGEMLERYIKRYRKQLIESTDANDNSALSEAAAGGDVATIMFFVQHGAKINAQGQFNRTPLYRASFGGHVGAVKLLLEHGADPRILDNDGMLPEQIAASPEITGLLHNWDIEQTEVILRKLDDDYNKQKEEENKLNKLEKERLEKNIEELEKDYRTKQKMLQHAYQELNKRINEHDKCAAEGFDKLEITLQAIHLAEDQLLAAQREEKLVREKLESCRVEVREQHIATGEEEYDHVKCNIRELDEVLMRDVGNKIKSSGKWPLLVDISTQAVTFLRYRDTNYLNVLNPRDVEKQTLRMALVGAIRYGKSLVLDMSEVNMMEFLEDRFGEIQSSLFQELLSKEILKNDKFLSLTYAEDGPEYTKENFVPSCVERFKLILVTKMPVIPRDWGERFYCMKIVTPSM